MSEVTWKAKLIKHHNINRIAVYFAKNSKLIGAIKEIKGARWSSSLKVWHLPDNAENRKRFKLPQKIIGKQNIYKIDPINQKAYEAYINLLYLKAYSPSTIKTYTIEFAQLLYLIKAKLVNELTVEQLRSYLLYCLQELRLSENQVHNRINAIKFYFEKVLKQPQIVLEIPRPKKASTLPKVISADDIGKMINQTTNLKHKTILMLAYGMGLRVSEIVNLKITDIDSKQMQHWTGLIYNDGKEIPAFPNEPECLIRKRIGELRNLHDTWYDIDEKTDENTLIVEMRTNISKYILPYFDSTKTKEDFLNLLDSEKLILAPLGKLIVYAELKQFEKAKTEYLTILKEKTNPHFLETVKEYGQKYGLDK